MATCSDLMVTLRLAKCLTALQHCFVERWLYFVVACSIYAVTSKLCRTGEQLTCTCCHLTCCLKYFVSHILSSWVVVGKRPALASCAGAHPFNLCSSSPTARWLQRRWFLRTLPFCFRHAFKRAVRPSLRYGNTSSTNTLLWSWRGEATF